MSLTKSRTCKSLTLAEKIAVIREVEKGLKKKSEVASEFGIPRNTLSSYLKNKEKILSSDCESGNNRKRFRTPDNVRSKDETKVEEGKNYVNNDDKLGYKPINESVIGSNQIAGEESVPNDQVYRIRYDCNTDEYLIGSTPISWDCKREEIYLGKGSKRTKFPYTAGLFHLLLETNVDENKYTVNDLALYKQILEFTVDHLRVTGILQGTQHPKYRKIIRPRIQSNVQSVTIHRNDAMKKDVYNTVYEVCLEDPPDSYSNDPNELVDRLLVLHMFKQSGNTVADTEIRLIEEKLAEEGYIQLN